MATAAAVVAPSATPAAAPVTPSTSTKRLKGTNFFIPIRLGSEAIPITDRDSATSQGIDPSHTHRWRIYLESLSGLPEDLSWFISKVQFSLHESFAQSRRVIETPPFEVSETGWGEFEVPIKIFFRDPQEKPVTVFHHLRLFSQPTPAMAIVKVPSMKNDDAIIWERYDELVFNDPTEFLMNLYRQHQKDAVRPSPPVFSAQFEKDEIELLNSSLTTVKKQLLEQKNRARKLLDQMTKTKEQIDELQLSQIQVFSTEESDLYETSTDLDEFDDDMNSTSDTGDDAEFGANKKKPKKKKQTKKIV